jgi:hypothetical protein
MNMSRLIEYLAGFMDGEGCISLNEVRHKVRISVVQTGEEPLQLYAKMFGGTVQFSNITAGGLPLYRYRTGDSIQCGKILLSLYPYLLVKEEKARIALGRLGLSVPTSSKTVSIGYLGGFMDGEGSVSVSIKSNNTTHPKITVAQNDLYPLQMFKLMYGGCICEKKSKYVKKSGQISRGFQWQLGQPNIIKFCNEMIPYTIVKQKQLKLMRQLVSINLGYGKRDEYKFEDRLELALMIKLLNRRENLRQEVDDMFAE